MTNLKPCPFCGGTARIDRTEGGYTVWCTNLDCPVSPHANYTSAKLAAECWNTRHTSEWQT